MIIPSLAIALLSFVIPYGIAFKLVAVSGVRHPADRRLGLRSAGPAALPGAGAAVGRRHRSSCSTAASRSTAATSRRPWPASSRSRSRCRSACSTSGCSPAASRPASTAAWAALLLALTGLCHLIPLIFVLVGTVHLVRAAPGQGPAQVVLATVLPVAGALTAFWTLPFVFRDGYMNDMGWEKITQLRRLPVRTASSLDAQLINVPDIEWVHRPRGGRPAAVDRLPPARRGVPGAARRRDGARLPLRARRPAVERPPAALLLPVALPARAPSAWPSWPACSPRCSPATSTGPSAGCRSRVAAASLRRRHRAWSRCRCRTCPAASSTPTAPTSGRRRGRCRSARPTRASSGRGPTWNFTGYEGTRRSAGGAEQYRKSYPEYHDIITDDGRPRRDQRAAVAPCGSTRSSTTATAPRWR